MADKNTKRAFQVLMGTNRPAYALWPATTGVPTAGIVLTPGAGAWGAYNDIIAAAAIATEFWLMSASYDTGAVGFGLHEVQFYNATLTTLLCEHRVDLTAANTNLPPFPFPIPIHLAANTQVQGRAGAAAAADLIGVTVKVATGL